MPRKLSASAGQAGEAPDRGQRATRKSGQKSRAGEKNAGGEAHPHTEENLDNGLKETFPASDPVSISPGAD